MGINGLVGVGHALLLTSVDSPVRFRAGSRRNPIATIGVGIAVMDGNLIPPSLSACMIARGGVFMEILL